MIKSITLLKLKSLIVTTETPESPQERKLTYENNRQHKQMIWAGNGL